MEDFVQEKEIVHLNSINVDENGFTNETRTRISHDDVEETTETIVDEITTVESPAPGKEHDSRKRTKALFAAACILLLQMCERISYYSVVANIVLFCTSSLGYDTVDATTISLVFSGCVYLMPVIGGYLSDAYAGRFLTLLISSIFILFGIALLIVSAMDFSQWFQNSISQTGKRIFFMLGLVLAAIGTGGVKANVSPFGAEQVEALGSEMVNSFFNWFYWITAVGSVVAYTGVAYIQQNISFVWGFFTPLAIMLLAVVIYLLAKPLYTTSKPQGSTLKMFFSVLRQGLCRRHESHQQLENTEHSNIAEYKGKAQTARKHSLLDGARVSYGGDYDDTTVNGIISVIKILPFCALVVMFWAIYSQGPIDWALSCSPAKLGCVRGEAYFLPLNGVGFNETLNMSTTEVGCLVRDRSGFRPAVRREQRSAKDMHNNDGTQSSFFIQALRMDVRVGDIKIPAAMLSTFTNLSIVLIIPVLDRVIYPFMSKIGFPVTLLKRIGIGLLFSTLAVIVAGIVEIYRKDYLTMPGGFHIQTLANKNFTASSLSVFVQTPQFVLVGIGEIFTAATTLEAGYTQAPPSLQGLLTGLFYAASGIGNLLTLGIMLVVEKTTQEDPWWGNEINNTKMENLMFLLAGLMATDFIIFCVVACKLSYRKAEAFTHKTQI